MLSVLDFEPDRDIDLEKAISFEEFVEIFKESEFNF
jgi:hypothetical protein